MKITNNVPRVIAEGSTKYSFVKPNEDPGKTCLISINEPDHEYAKIHDEVTGLKAWDDVLRIAFWDITKRIPDLRFINEWVEPMTEEQGKEIAEFIKKHSDASIIVHCMAGISRSAAVVRLLLELGWQEGKVLKIHDQGAANIHVYSTIKKHFPELLPIGA